ncbi:hypothetical protein ACWCP6_19995 [Streptomyces sp. NPDC002004]
MSCSEWPIAAPTAAHSLRHRSRPPDLLPGGVETVVGADSTLAANVDRLMFDISHVIKAWSGRRHPL